MLLDFCGTWNSSTLSGEMQLHLGVIKRCMRLTKQNATEATQVDDWIVWCLILIFTKLSHFFPHTVFFLYFFSSLYYELNYMFSGELLKQQQQRETKMYFHMIYILFHFHTNNLLNLFSFHIFIVFSSFMKTIFQSFLFCC